MLFRKKSITESLPASPSKENAVSPSPSTVQPEPVPSKDKINKEKSPVKDATTSSKEKPVKEVEKQREKSPKKICEVASKEPIKSKSTKLSEAENEIKDSRPVSNKVHTPEKKTKPEENVKRVAETGKKTEKAEVTVKKPVKAEEVEKKGRKVENVSDNEQEAVVVGELSLKLGEVGKISEVGTSTQEVVGHGASDSSDSESEAEKLLKIVSEKREKVEAARQEKLRKVTEAKDGKQDMPAIKEERPVKSPSQSKSPSQTKSPSQSKSSLQSNKNIPQSAPKTEVKESAPEHKFATLPRGFKSKTPQRPVQSHPTPAVAGTTHIYPNRKEEQEDKGINQEIEGMMSAIKAVDRAITKVGN